MKTLSSVLAILVVIATPLMVSAQDATVEDLVNQAVAMWNKKGKDCTIKAIKTPVGPLRKGGIYMFAGDLSGKMLAHPTQPDLCKFDQWELQDASGKFIVQEFIRAAKSAEGFGYVEYDWIQVNQAEPTKKRTFIKRVPGKDIFVAAGYYLD